MMMDDWWWRRRDSGWLMIIDDDRHLFRMALPLEPVLWSPDRCPLREVKLEESKVRGGPDHVLLAHMGHRRVDLPLLNLQLVFRSSRLRFIPGSRWEARLGVRLVMLRSWFTGQVLTAKHRQLTPDPDLLSFLQTDDPSDDSGVDVNSHQPQHPPHTFGLDGWV